jgi:hypothetical protein
MCASGGGLEAVSRTQASSAPLPSSPTSFHHLLPPTSTILSILLSLYSPRSWLPRPQPTTHAHLHSTPPPVQALAYYGGMLAYFWLLATPVVGLVFGVYLYVSVCWAGVHFDE